MSPTPDKTWLNIWFAWGAQREDGGIQNLGSCRVSVAVAACVQFGSRPDVSTSNWKTNAWPFVGVVPQEAFKRFRQNASQQHLFHKSSRSQAGQLFMRPTIDKT